MKNLYLWQLGWFICMFFLIPQCLKYTQKNRPIIKTTPSFTTDSLVQDTSILAATTSEVKDSLPPIHVNNLSVPQWLGKKFRLLEKTKMFQRFGYELYTSPLLAAETKPQDTSLVLDNCRLKYTPFKSITVSVTDIKEIPDGEYLVTFYAESKAMNIYGKTTNGIIEGLAHNDDLSLARQQWEGNYVFSRRRSIDIFDSLSSSFVNHKVSIAESLKVTSVRWGVTPLPPKSLWLMVETSSGLKGIIPINYSWTNVLQTEQTSAPPWDKDIFRENPKKKYSWDEYVWETIDKHNIFVGMTSEQVKVSWGDPIRSHHAKQKAITKFDYQGKTLIFRNDTLISVE